MSQRFDGRSGKKPQAEARRHVYRSLVCLIDDYGGAIVGDIDDPFDRRRLDKAIAAVRKELQKKADY